MDHLGTSSELTAGKEKARDTGAQINHGDRLAQASTSTSTITTGSGAGSNLGHMVSFGAQVFGKECLKQVGREYT